jgi:hypothetical protein
MRGLVKDRIIPSEKNESKLYNSTGTTSIPIMLNKPKYFQKDAILHILVIYATIVCGTL